MRRLLTLLIFFLPMVPASAQPIDILNIEASWDNRTWLRPVRGDGTDTIYWRDNFFGSGPWSSMYADTPADILGTSQGTQFALSTITHTNADGGWLSWVNFDLDLMMDVRIDGIIYDAVEFSINVRSDDFFHDEDDMNDYFTVIGDLFDYRLIQAGGQEYFVKLKGLISNNVEVRNWTTPEDDATIVYLMGEAGLVTSPEPSTYLLLGATLLLVSYIRNKQGAKRQQVG